MDLFVGIQIQEAYVDQLVEFLWNFLSRTRMTSIFCNRMDGSSHTHTCHSHSLGHHSHSLDCRSHTGNHSPGHCSHNPGRHSSCCSSTWFQEWRIWLKSRESVSTVWASPSACVLLYAPSTVGGHITGLVDHMYPTNLH